MAFQTKELYGGAIVVDFPTGYYDVSKLRQVPDHQEVYQEEDGFDSIIVEIMEYVANLTPTAAARFHLEDYADEPGLKVWKIEDVRMNKLPSTAVAAILATSPVDDKGKCVGIYLLNIRLEEHDTDLLITMNLKDVDVGTAASYDDLFSATADPAFKRGRDIVLKMIQSFEIKNSGLFHPDQ